MSIHTLTGGAVDCVAQESSIVVVRGDQRWDQLMDNIT